LASNLGSPTPQAFVPQHVFGATSKLTPGKSPGLFAAPLSWSAFQDGTKANPYVVMVNLARPEANREFDIQYVEKMKAGHYERNGFHIRMTVSCPDYDQWEAYIPKDGVFPMEYHRRLIMVRGPSRTFFECDSAMYHTKGTAVIDCPATKNAHLSTEIAIERDDLRQWSYYLLVFDAGVHLDNQIFSDDEHLLPRVENGLNCKAADNVFNKDIRGMTIFWRIAVTGGRKVSRAANQKDAKTMFAD
jgi:hypothetical protein